MDRCNQLHPAMNRPVDITALLEAWTQGDLEARDQLIPAVDDELRRRAAASRRRERAGQTLQPTALVHEVYLRLVDQDRAVWQNRAQFLAVASEMMRRILVDSASAGAFEGMQQSASPLILAGSGDQFTTDGSTTISM